MKFLIPFFIITSSYAAITPDECVKTIREYLQFNDTDTISFNGVDKNGNQCEFELASEISSDDQGSDGDIRFSIDSSEFGFDVNGTLSMRPTFVKQKVKKCEINKRNELYIYVYRKQVSGWKEKFRTRITLTKVDNVLAEVKMKRKVSGFFSTTMRTNNTCRKN